MVFQSLLDNDKHLDKEAEVLHALLTLAWRDSQLHSKFVVGSNLYKNGRQLAVMLEQIKEHITLGS